MNLKKWVGFGFVGAAALLGASSPASAQNAVAEINLVTGRGTVSNEESAIRAATKGDKVFSGEVVSTGPNTYVNLKFIDGSFVLIRPKSRFQIEDFQLAGAAPATPAAPARPSAPKPAVTPQAPVAATAAGSSRAFFRLLKGGFRAVSGAVGRLDRNEYRVATPVATIGIRGTDYSAIICDAACAADPVIRNELTEGDLAEGGLVAGVDEGGIDVSSSGTNCDNKQQVGGVCPVDKSQNLLVTRDGSQFRLGEVPKFLASDPIPDPRACGL